MLTRPAGRGKGVSRARLWVNVANALAYIVPLYAFIGYCFLSGDAWSATPNAGMRAHKHDRGTACISSRLTGVFVVTHTGRLATDRGFS